MVKWGCSCLCKLHIGGLNQSIVSLGWILDINDTVRWLVGSSLLDFDPGQSMIGEWSSETPSSLRRKFSCIQICDLVKCSNFGPMLSTMGFFLLSSPLGLTSIQTFGNEHLAHCQVDKEPSRVTREVLIRWEITSDPSQPHHEVTRVKAFSKAK